ncbi:MAG TPA: DUF1801 domain-containing protein [Cyclobacteriaceae bacterium]|nr:DUF1801 domain-containing protein [Cyclobacteriaceae bacterium]
MAKLNSAFNTTIDDYISGFPEETRAVLERMRSTIKKAAPNTEETISYGIPTFKLNGSYVVYFAGFNNHVSLYPAPRGNKVFKKELSAYKGGKGTVQFPLNKPLPIGLIARIVKHGLKENLKRTAGNKTT